MATLFNGMGSKMSIRYSAEWQHSSFFVYFSSFLILFSSHFTQDSMLSKMATLFRSLALYAIPQKSIAILLGAKWPSGILQNCNFNPFSSIFILFHPFSSFFILFHPFYPKLYLFSP